MKTLIYKKLNFHSPLYIPSNFFSSKTRKNHHDLLRIHPQNSHYTLQTPRLCYAAAPQSLSYGGWDGSQLDGESVNSGESNQFHNLLSSFGIADKKYVFVYLFGFICALAISRVKVSAIMIFPASAIVFALGFSVGLVKGGQSKESRSNENMKKIIEEKFRSFIEKLRDNLKGYNAEVLKLKNGIRESIEYNQVTVSDLEGYIDVIESADISLQNSVDFVESCVNSLLYGNKGNEGVLERDSGKRRKKSVGDGFNFPQYFDGLFGGSKTSKVEGSNKTDVEETKNKKLENILVAPIEKGKNMNFSPNEDLENKSASTLDDLFDNNTVKVQNRAESFDDGTEMENIAFESDEINGTSKAVFDQTIYNYRNKTSRFVSNQQIHLKDYQDEIETMSSHNTSFNSVDVSISMNHQMKRETLHRNYSHLENTKDDQQEFYRNSQSSVLGNDLEFNRYLEEANNLLKEAKGRLRQTDNDQAERALQKSALLLSKAIEMRPMSLLAVGQLGNTYLLHGELKLKTSRELRSVLVRDDPLFGEEWGKVPNRFEDRFTKKNEITSVLVNVCEECEELLIKAGRKYKLALSIDGNDMRALYNWGLALTFRAQLIADIGPSGARDADKIFLAAIDKFDAMMSKSNEYAPDALFRWGAALQHRSRLRPSRSREKVKLLQQARRLYEDALDMDSGNRPLKQALSSCAFLYMSAYDFRKSAKQIVGRPSRRLGAFVIQVGA
ncbi:hypothetical protein PHJA_002704500 [Phtheirospermum japonicum]|uniref:Uncharacterized protein n=1 Tax=Phtheirospermum japonicum TaxID=374723 RepID=A0A830DC09_9LAMI|nr:hypothetical protein PHJA_002704500 [Phtheirospermum japonicum]